MKTEWNYINLAAIANKTSIIRKFPHYLYNHNQIRREAC